MMKNEIKRTPLRQWHASHHANMADFGGYEMPLWYASVKDENLSVLTGAGIFDTSHMATVMVNGPGAYELLQLCHTKDLARCIGPDKKPLYAGRCIYSAFLNESGEALDDAIIYQLEKNNYMVVVNAGMGKEIVGHLNRYKIKQNVEVIDLTDQVGKMDIQGIAAAKVMKKILVDPDSVFEKMPYFSFKGFFNASNAFSKKILTADGTPILLSRTGYTGEFGFEIFVDPNKILKLWEMILEAGKEFDITPCGLAARDSLRVGAVLPLSHQDIGPWPFVNHPWSFALPYNKDHSGFTKDFIGSKALENGSCLQHTYAFVGNDLRKISAGDSAVVLNAKGETIGTVLTCVTDMGIGRHKERIYSIASPDKPEGFKSKGLCCGFVRVTSKLVAGQIIEIMDNRRKLSVTVTNDIRPDRTARCPIKKMI